MKSEQSSKRITGFAALLVFALFAVCIMAVLLSGAKVYRVLTDREEINYDLRTAAQYITTRVRQADRGGAVSVEDFGGAEALVLWETIDGEEYETRVYCHEGYIRELFTAAGGEFSPEDGEKVLPAEGISFSWQAPELEATLTINGVTEELSLFLRAGEGAVS